jgi:hypothetical protein
MTDIGLSPGLLIKAARAIWNGSAFVLRDPYAARRHIQQLKWWGISWDFRGFLGMHRSGSAPIFISCVQIFGTNKSKRPVRRIDGHIRSNVTGDRLPLTMEGMRPGETNGIPAGCRFFVQALFRDGSAEQEGFIEDRFRSEWRDFTFTFTCDEQQYIHRFRAPEVLKCIERFRESSAPRPTPVITRRMTE